MTSLMGFNANQILQYMIQQVPGLQGPVSQALQKGFNANQILKYLHSNKGNLKGMKYNDPYGDPLSYAGERQYGKSEQEKQIARLSAFLGTSAIGGLIASGFGGSASQAIRGQILPAISPTQAQQPTTLNIPNPQIQAPQQAQIPYQQQQIGGPSPIVPPPSPSPISPQPTPSGQEMPFPNKSSPLDALGKLLPIDHLLNIHRSNPSNPQAIEAIIRSKRSKNDVSAVEKEYGKPINSIIQEALPELQIQDKNTPIQKVSGITEQELNEIKYPKPKEIKPIKSTTQLQPGDRVKTAAGEYGMLKSIKDKSALVDIGGKVRKVAREDLSLARKGEGEYQQRDIVGTSDGRAGMIDRIEGDKAYVNIAGKLHEMKLDEIDKEPKWLKNVKVDIDKAKVVEGSDLSSAMINGINYDPGRKEMYVDFRGSPYVFFDVPREVFENIKKGKWSAKTTGATGRGLWSAGEGNSIGASVIKELKNAGYDYEVLTEGEEKPFKRGEEVHIKNDGTGTITSAGKGQSVVKVEGEKKTIKNKNLEKL